MRKLFALLFVASVFTFASCEKKAETSNADTATKDSAATDVVAPVQPTDTMAKDSASMDTTKK